jgi:hypothetical protein
MTIPGIEFYGVCGRAIVADGLLLVPARFNFEPGADGPVECESPAFLHDPPPLRRLLGNDDLGYDFLLACWARARIPLAFGVWPLEGSNVERDELLDLPFLAVRLEGASIVDVVPFVCTQNGEGGPGLIFRETDRVPLLKTRIASAFWGVLLRAPEELAGFEAILDECEGGYYKVEFTHGQLLVGDTDEEDAGRSLLFRSEQFRCPDCDGTGIDDFFPFTDDCPTCGGTGAVTW